MIRLRGHIIFRNCPLSLLWTEFLVVEWAFCFVQVTEQYALWIRKLTHYSDFFNMQDCAIEMGPMPAHVSHWQINNHQMAMLTACETDQTVRLWSGWERRVISVFILGVIFFLHWLKPLVDTKLKKIIHCVCKDINIFLYDSYEYVLGRHSTFSSLLQLTFQACEIVA